MVTAGIISVVIGGHFGGGDHFDGGDHFGGGTATGWLQIKPSGSGDENVEVRDRSACVSLPR